MAEQLPVAGSVGGLSDRRTTLAARYYVDRSVFEAERADLLRNTWQFVCHESLIAEPGRYYAFTLHGADLFLVRRRDGEIGCYYNACPHRGHRLVEGSGSKARIVCPYHAWTFNLDGSLRGARGVARKNAPPVGLMGVRVDCLAGFVFVCRSPDTPPLNAYAPGLAAQILSVCPDLGEFITDTSGEDLGHTYECAANWKVMLDNYLECYHCQMAHASFNDMMAIGDSRFALYQNFTHQVAPTARREENAAFPLDLEHDVLVGNFWFLFPNTTLGQFPGARGFYVSRFDPVAPGLTSRVSVTMKPAAPTDAGAAERDRLRSVWSQTVVSQEDKSLCENVQRGMEHTPFEHGWYAIAPDDHGISEHAMRYFHDLYLAWAEGAGV